jgi:CheY-like chemotaxis protein
VLLDDDADTAEMYRLGLEALGFRVLVVDEPAALFEALAHEVPDALVLDYRLRGTTGADVLEQLREDSRMVRLPVLLLSNHLGYDDGAVDRVFAAGALAWLRKPTTPPHVLARRLLQAIARTRYARRVDDHV